jgi:hypothetical protein
MVTKYSRNLTKYSPILITVLEHLKYRNYFCCKRFVVNLPRSLGSWEHDTTFYFLGSRKC